MITATYVGVDTKRTYHGAKGVSWPRGIPGRADTLGALPIQLADAVQELAGRHGAPIETGADIQRLLRAAIDYTGETPSADAHNAAWCIVALREGVA